MKKILLVAGTGSHVLKELNIDNIYEKKFALDRHSKEKANIANMNCIKFELSDDIIESYHEIKKNIEELNFDKIDIIFSSYDSNALDHLNNPHKIKSSLFNNIAQPLNLFSSLSLDYFDKHINGIYISSIYAHVAPKPSNYPSSEKINPLYYGVSKAAVEQGIRWLSVQNQKHIFNSIALGPMPNSSAIKNGDFIVESLLGSMPSGEFVSHKSLHKTINYILSLNDTSLRGSTITLDGGYTIL